MLFIFLYSGPLFTCRPDMTWMECLLAEVMSSEETFNKVYDRAFTNMSLSKNKYTPVVALPSITSTAAAPVGGVGVNNNNSNGAFTTTPRRGSAVGMGINAGVGTGMSTLTSTGSHPLSTGTSFTTSSRVAMPASCLPAGLSVVGASPTFPSPLTRLTSSATLALLVLDEDNDKDQDVGRDNGIEKDKDKDKDRERESSKGRKERIEGARKKRGMLATKEKSVRNIGQGKDRRDSNKDHVNMNINSTKDRFLTKTKSFSNHQRMDVK